MKTERRQCWCCSGTGETNELVLEPEDFAFPAFDFTTEPVEFNLEPLSDIDAVLKNPPDSCVLCGRGA